MDVRLGSRSIKTFSSAILCLSKIGRDLYIEANQEKLVLRTLNDSKAAFSAFTFSPDEFFDEFVCGREDGSSFGCKLLLKAILGVLKSIRRVMSLRIFLDEGEPEEVEGLAVEPHLVFDLQSDTGIEKRYHFHIQDCDNLQATFHHEGASRLTAPSDRLIALLDHIQGSYEVAFFAEQDRVRVKTFRPDDPMSAGGDTPGVAALTTEMSISSNDFEHYELATAEDMELALVFSMREIKSLLNFCEANDKLMPSLLFHGGGRPILITAEDASLHVELMLATYMPNDEEPPLTQSRRERSRRPQAEEEEQAAPAPPPNEDDEDEERVRRDEDEDRGESQQYEDQQQPPPMEEVNQEHNFDAEDHHDDDALLPLGSQSTTTSSSATSGNQRPSQATTMSLNSTLGATHLMAMRGPQVGSSSNRGGVVDRREGPN